MKRHVIKPHRPLRTILLVVVAVIAGAAGVLAFSAGERGPLQAALEELHEERDSLASAVTMLRSRNEELRERVAILERGQQVESKAYADVGQHLRSLQDEVLALKEEVAFYRGIVSSGKEKGLNIQTFVVDKENVEGAFRFQLVLTQHLKRVKQISGTVRISVMDENGNQPRDLTLVDLEGRERPEIEFEFKYFQRLEGRFTLPDGVSPQRVLVRVFPSGKSPKSVEQGFDWNSLLS
ncbi:MAG: DUF6776 family protein [Gammaproteobacteria bacterium]|nr:DUF6776 family protein [Gammaproteobacteria bacterium]